MVTAAFGMHHTHQSTAALLCFSHGPNHVCKTAAQLIVWSWAISRVSGNLFAPNSLSQRFWHQNHHRHLPEPGHPPLSPPLLLLLGFPGSPHRHHAQAAIPAGLQQQQQQKLAWRQASLWLSLQQWQKMFIIIHMKKKFARKIVKLLDRKEYRYV